MINTEQEQGKKAIQNLIKLTKEKVKAEEFKTLCRECKKEFKFNGDAFGFCNQNCKKKHLKKCHPSKIIDSKFLNGLRSLRK